MKLMCSLLFWLGWAGTLALAQTAPWVYVNLKDDVKQDGQYPDFVIDRFGVQHIVYWDGPTDKLIYGRKGQATGIWTWEDPAPQLRGGYRSTLAVDDTGGIHIAFFENVFGKMRVRYARKTNAGWQVEAPEQVNRGDYGPAFLMGAGVVQATIRILVEGPKVLILFFDGTYLPAQGIYGMELFRAIRQPNQQWVVEGFGNIPAYGPDALFDEGLAGGRYGEYTDFVRQPNGRLSLFTCVKVNGEILRIDQDPNDTTLRQYLAFQKVDSTRRITDPATTPIIRRVMTFEGLSAVRLPDSSIHLTYGLTSEYNKSGGFPQFWGLYYTRISANGTPTHQRLQPATQDNVTRTYTQLASRGRDTLLLTYAEFELDRFRFAYSTNRGQTWNYRTLVETPFPKSHARMQMDADSLYIVFYDNSCQCLKQARLPLNNLNAAWQIVTLTRTEESGNVLDAIVTGTGNAPIVHVLYTDAATRDLWYGRWSLSAGYQTRLLASGLQINSVSLVAGAAGKIHCLYSDRGNSNLQWVTVNLNLSFSTSMVESGIYGDNLRAAASGDTIYLAYFDPVAEVLRCSFRLPPGIIWQTEQVDPSTKVGQFPSIALFPNRQPAVVYRAPDAQQIRYATRTLTGNWIRDTVLSRTGQQFGTFLDLRLVPNLNPIVSYRNETGNTVGFAERVNGVWQVQDSLVTTGTLATVGEGMNLTVDSAGFRWIAYDSQSSVRTVGLLAQRGTGSNFRSAVVNSNVVQIGGSFRFLTVGNRYLLIGKKNEPGNPGLGLLYTIRLGETVTALEPAQPQQLEAVVYPNPALESAELLFTTSQNSPAELHLRDMLGQSVATHRYNLLTVGEQRLKLERGNLPAGLYWVEVRLPALGQQVVARVLFR